MDSIGLLAAWVGVVSLILTLMLAIAVHLFLPTLQHWWARSSPRRAEQRILELELGLVAHNSPDNAYLADLISVYASAVLHLVGAASIVVIAILILDLGPALLAAVLPFNVDTKRLTRFTGVLILASSYFFIFRLTYLAVKIRLKTVVRRRDYVNWASKEIVQLRSRHPRTPMEFAGRIERKVQGSAVDIEPETSGRI